jgi:hypothetical protein
MGAEALAPSWARAYASRIKKNMIFLFGGGICIGKERGRSRKAAKVK